MKKRIITGLLMVILMLSACSSSKETDAKSIEAGIDNINKYGNIILTIGPDSMIDLGYEPADIVLVKTGDAEMEMPVGTNYSDVDPGEPICCFKKSDTKDRDVVILAINSGNMAEALGIAGRDDADSLPVYISMSEKQGYADELAMHQLGNTRSNKRADYAWLSDADYANFRAVETTGIGANILYRSSSPVNPVLNRNKEADRALLDSGIRTVMNMADREETMKRFADYGLTAYSQCDIIALDMTLDFGSDEYKEKLANGFRFIASHDGPYLIHCIEGKDRTGYAAAILECLMGADVDEIVKDYMLTYYNYYGIEPGTEQYRQISERNIEATLANTFGIQSVNDDSVDLRSCAEDYLKDIGLSAEEIAALKESLS